MFGTGFASRDTLKYFLGNANSKTKVVAWLKCAFSRWCVERCFEDDKSYIGLDPLEGRSYPGLMRNLILRAVSLMFLARMREEFQQAYPEVLGLVLISTRLQGLDRDQASDLVQRFVADMIEGRDSAKAGQLYG